MKKTFKCSCGKECCLKDTETQTEVYGDNTEYGFIVRCICCEKDL